MIHNDEIIKIYGTDYKDMTKRLLEEADLSARIGAGMRIGIKPNLVCPSPAMFGATTHPEVVAGIIEYLREHGHENIKIIEGSWIGDTTQDSFEYCGYNSLSREYGIELVDTQQEGSYAVFGAGLELKLCNCLKDIDFLINVPVLKGHCQTKITCALKNMKGLIPNTEKRRFHTLGLHKPVAHLNAAIRQDFIVIDHICGDLDFEEGGNPIVRNCVMAAVDPVLTDAYVCKLLGYTADDVPYIKYAEALGVGDANLDHLRLRTIYRSAPLNTGGSKTHATGCENRVPHERGAPSLVSAQEKGGMSENHHNESVPASSCEEDMIVYYEELESVTPVTHKILEVSYAADDADSCSACYASLTAAMMRLKSEGLLDNFTGKLSIGQGHRGQTGQYGIGNCTCKFEHYVKGCPPEEDDVYEEVKSWIVNST